MFLGSSWDDCTDKILDNHRSRPSIIGQQPSYGMISHYRLLSVMITTVYCTRIQFRKDLLLCGRMADVRADCKLDFSEVNYNDVCRL